MDEIELFIQNNPSFRGLSREAIQGILNQRGGVQPQMQPYSYPETNPNAVSFTQQQPIPYGQANQFAANYQFPNPIPQDNNSPNGNPFASMPPVQPNYFGSLLNAETANAGYTPLENKIDYTQNPYYPTTGMPTALSGKEEKGGEKTGKEKEIYNFGSPWGTGVVGALELITGLSQAWKDRNTKPADYSLDPNVATMQAEAMGRRNEGFSEQQRKAYEDKIYNDMVSKYVMGKNISGGQGSQAILSAIVGQNNQNRNQLAIADAQQELANRSFANQINQFVQGQENMATEQKRQDYYQKQQATAAAIKGGLTNLGTFADVATGNPLALLSLL